MHDWCVLELYYVYMWLCKQGGTLRRRGSKEDFQCGQEVKYENCTTLYSVPLLSRICNHVIKLCHAKLTIDSQSDRI